MSTVNYVNKLLCKQCIFNDFKSHVIYNIYYTIIEKIMKVDNSRRIKYKINVHIYVYSIFKLYNSLY